MCSSDLDDPLMQFVDLRDIAIARATRITPPAWMHTLIESDQAPLMLAGGLAKGRDFARAIGSPELVVCDEGHAVGRRMRDYGGFGDPASPKNALLVECGQHWQRSSVDVADRTLRRFLDRLGMVTADRGATDAEPPPQRVIEVTHAITIASDRFRFLGDYKGLEVIPTAGTEIARDGDRVVRTPYDSCVLIMPTRRVIAGQTAVRLGRDVA